MFIDGSAKTDKYYCQVANPPGGHMPKSPNTKTGSSKAMLNELKNLRQKVEELEGFKAKCEQLERSLRQSEERFEKIFHASSNLMTITTLEEGRILDANEVSVHYGGFKREELIGKTLAECNLFANPKRQRETYRRLREEGKIHNLETNVRTKSGEIRTVLYSADPILMNDEPCLLNISVDITEREKEKDALKKSEEKYRVLVENSLQGLSIVQGDRFVFCNNAFATMTGYSVEELLSFPSANLLIYPEDRAAIEKRYRDRMAGRPVSTGHEHRIVRKDGTVRWTEIRSSAIEHNGRPATQVVNMDITEHRQAEEALRHSEKLLSDILNSSPIPQFVIDKDHRIIKWNKALEVYSGIKAEDVVDTDQQWRPFYEKKRPLMADLLVDGAVEKIAQLYAGKYAKSTLAAGAYEGTDFFPEMGKDGKWLHFTASAIQDSNGNIIGAVETLKDITEWRRAEEEIRDSREYLNRIINCIGDPIFVKDREHRIVLVNDAMCTFIGMLREELLGIAEMPLAVAKSLWEQEEAVFETGKEIITEDEFPVAQDNPRIVMTKKSLLADKNGNKQIVGVLRDITEYKRLEAQFRQAQKMEAIGVLAGGVAHDFNNLLSVINGYCELTLEDLDRDNPMRSNIEQIREAGKSATSLTSQLLAFGRKQILQPEILDLNDIITQMSSMLRRMIRESIELVTIAHPGLGLVSADPGQIQQIVMNLAVNAHDAMLEGGNLTIETANVHFDEEHIRKHPEAKAGSYVMLAIGDNGMGMDASTQARIFEPFFTTKAKGKGTGLGLATVYGIVKQSNGFIWVYSEPGKGTTFKVYFPRVEGDIAEFMEESKSEQEARGVETVLMAEDEPSVRTLAARILRGRGYTVFEASNGKEALDIAEKYAGEIHLVLTDVVMPGISGRELVSRLETVRPGIKSLYVSGYTDTAIVHNGMLDSGIAFLQKPFTVEDLTRKVREVFDS